MKSIVGRRNFGAVWVCIAVLCLMPKVANCRTITVQADGNGDYPTIQDAIDDSNDGDVIILAEGIYTGTGNRDIDFKGKQITVQSTNPNCPIVLASTIIDCNGTEAEPHRGFYFHSGEDGNSVVAGLTIRNGYTYNGAGVYCNSSSPTIINCNFINGSAEDWGGGIYCYKSSPLISNCTFTGNSAFEGGAITSRSYWNYLCSPHIENCHIFGNTASGSGGGINNDCLSAPIISNCLITGNYAGMYGGGGISIWQSIPTILNCLITDNSTNGWGSGIRQSYDYEDGSTIINCTIIGNMGEGNDETGIFCSSKMVVTNSILGNNIDITPGDFLWTECDVTFSYCDVLGSGGSGPQWNVPLVTDGGGNIDEDPCFVLPGYWDGNGVWVEGDYHLFEASPCIDAGDNTAVPAGVTTDLDGNPRFVDDPDIPDTGNGTPPIVDMGAYEYNPPVAAEVDIEPDTLNLQSKGVITAFIELPEPYSVENIDPDSLLCQGAGAIRAIIAGDILIVKFDREELQELQADEEVELLVTGELADGTRFEGTDVIRVIDKAGKKGN